MSLQKTTKQISHWAGEEGRAYIDRNPQSIKEFEEVYMKDYGVTRVAMNEEFLADLPRDIRILEVGANIGLQLEFLRTKGFTNLLGIEVNPYGVERAKALHPKVDIIHGSGFELPFKDGWFDLVYTSGVLIHISPADVGGIMSEMHRVSRGLIWGFEYYAPTYTEIAYRGKEDLLWKTDFAALYASRFPDLTLVREKKYPMTDGVNASQMFLLRKRA